MIVERRREGSQRKMKPQKAEVSFLMPESEILMNIGGVWYWFKPETSEECKTLLDEVDRVWKSMKARERYLAKRK